MQIQLFGHLLLQVLQERQELLVAMARLALRQHFPRSCIQGCEQCRGAMADVIVRDAFDVTQSHGQHGLGALQGLALALLIHTQHDCVRWWPQIQAHNVTHLLHEVWVGGELEALAAVWLQSKEVEVTRHLALGDACGKSCRAHAPVRG